MTTCRLAAALLLAQLATLPAWAQELIPGPRVARRHIVFLREGLDTIFGNYIFAVENGAADEQRFKAAVMLPKETVDFGATEGIEPQDVHLDGEQVVVERAFPSGVHIVGVAFKANARFGKATLTFQAPQAIESLTVLVPKGGGMRIASDRFASAPDPSASPDEKYDAFANKAPIAQGDTVEVQVAGLPEGRASIWIIGGVVAGILVLLASVLALRTRPRIKDDGGVSVLVN